LTGLRGVIAVVQPNAQNLVRSGDRRADSLARESGELTGRSALDYQGLNPIEPSSAENASSKSGTASDRST
jgi:hypothetical protein